VDRQQLRDALARETNGQRDVRIEFDRGPCCTVKQARLISYEADSLVSPPPTAADSLIKLFDGTKTFIVDADRVIWIEIG
jgi:hypothetical protein